MLSYMLNLFKFKNSATKTQIDFYVRNLSYFNFPIYFCELNPLELSG